MALYQTEKLLDPLFALYSESPRAIILPQEVHVAPAVLSFLYNPSKKKSQTTTSLCTKLNKTLCVDIYMRRDCFFFFMAKTVQLGLELSYSNTARQII